MVTLAKLIGAPGSWGFLLCAGVIAVAMARTRRRAAIVLGCLSAFYVALSLPIVANAFADRLQPAGASPAVPAGSATLVVLGGDNSNARMLEAVRLARARRPDRAVVLGDPWIAQALFDAGLPRDRVIQDDGAARTTREQIAYLARLDPPAGHVVVVASRLQMPRVIRLARASGLEIVPAASGLDMPPATTGRRRWFPSIDALHVSRDAIYEHAALAYYQWRGWIH